MAKTHKLYKTSFTVEGTGEFPFDMLRYDRAACRQEIDTHIMLSRHLRQVELIMFSLTKDGPTIDRWESFGWKVLKQEIIKPYD